MKTDFELQKDVSAELQWEHSVRAARIGVEVHDGVVTLSSPVHGWQARNAATPSAWRTPGVRNVIDRLTLVA